MNSADQFITMILKPLRYAQSLKIIAYCNETFRHEFGFGCCTQVFSAPQDSIAEKGPSFEAGIVVHYKGRLVQPLPFHHVQNNLCVPARAEYEYLIQCSLAQGSVCSRFFKVSLREVGPAVRGKVISRDCFGFGLSRDGQFQGRICLTQTKASACSIPTKPPR